MVSNRNRCAHSIYLIKLTDRYFRLKSALASIKGAAQDRPATAGLAGAEQTTLYYEHTVGSVVDVSWSGSALCIFSICTGKASMI
ncbi:MAG TPA: hypothetical protein EYP93_07360 [Gammaproteobacteria bacterium]|nr:hypothetical protein [Gammaproteobacteria bacterium]